MTLDAEPTPLASVSSLADFRRQKEAQQQKHQVRFRMTLDPTDGTVVLSGNGVSQPHVFSQEGLAFMSRWFRDWERLLSMRQWREKRAKEGKCCWDSCKLKPWKGTGMCRSCMARFIPKARELYRDDLTVKATSFSEVPTRNPFTENEPA